MVRFIEVISELHYGRLLVSINKARSIAQQLMQVCGKGHDGLVNEEEFIHGSAFSSDLLIIDNLVLYLVVNRNEQFK